MIVPDINLLLYAVNSSMPQHERASEWLTRLFTGDEPVGLTWMVLVGFMRLATNSRIFSSPMRVEQAIEVVDSWLSHRLVTVVDATPGHWALLSALLRESGTAGNLTNDAYLAAICIERGATLHSADGDFHRFRGLRWENPLLAT